MDKSVSRRGIAEALVHTMRARRILGKSAADLGLLESYQIDQAVRMLEAKLRNPVMPRKDECLEDIRDLRDVPLRLAYAAQLLFADGDVEEAERLLNLALDELKRLDSGYNTFKQAIVLRALAAIYQRQGRTEKAANTYCEALDCMLRENPALQLAYDQGIIASPPEENVVPFRHDILRHCTDQ
jgi:tetratricopeptide (TPR) repeat protein